MIMKINQSLKKQRGIGLLELMLSLAIIAILLVMATRYYVVSSRSESVNRLVTLIGSLKGAIASFNGPVASQTNLAQELINMGTIAGGDQNAAGNGVVSQYGPVTLTSVAGSVTIAVESLPQEVCVALLNRFAGDNTVSAGTGGCIAGNSNTISAVVPHQ